MNRNFQEYHLRCANCDSTNYKHRKGYHLWNHYHCNACDSNFHSPRPVSNRTASNRYDSHRASTYENINKSHNNKRWLWRLLVILAIGIAIIVLVVKEGWMVLLSIPMALFIWWFITHPPTKKHKGKIKW